MCNAFAGMKGPVAPVAPVAPVDGINRTLVRPPCYIAALGAGNGHRQVRLATGAPAGVRLVVVGLVVGRLVVDGSVLVGEGRGRKKKNKKNIP